MWTRCQAISRPTLVAIVPLAALLLAAALPVQAHLALIRQGSESADLAEWMDHFGRQLATGDFNGDGFEDLASAAPDESNQINETPVQGNIVVNYGSAVGLVPEGADLLTVGAVTDDVVRYGRGLAAGDFNDDGFDDLAVGLPELDDLSIVDAGAVWIHYGSALGLAATPALILRQDDVTGAAVEADDLFGYTLASGYFNDDSYADIAVGSFGEDADAGAVFWFYGSAAGITTAGAGWAKQSTLGGTDDSGDWFSYALACGDFDGNGFDDLAIGTPNEHVDPYPTAGRVYIMTSNSGGLINGVASQWDLVSIGEAPQSDVKFGWSLAAGIFDPSDAVDDLAVGAPEWGCHRRR